MFGKFFEVIACTYAVLRNASLLFNAAPLNVLLSPILMIWAVLLTTIAYFLLLPLICYKIVINLVLKIKYKENYCGLLRGPDVIWTIDHKHNNNNKIINYLLLFKFDSVKHDENLVDEITTRLFRSSRLTCVRRSFMGFSFLVKNQLKAEDVVQVLPATMDLSSLSNLPLPRNNSAAWELLVATQPMVFEDSENCFYPVLIRIHHSIGDGVTFLSLLRQISDDNNVEIPQSQTNGVCKLPPQNPQHDNGAWGRFKNFAQLHSRMILPFRSADKNDLRSPNLSEGKWMGMYIESEKKYLDVIKGMKRKFDGVNFSPVVLTAISASLQEYLEKQSKKPPKNLTLSFMIMADRNCVTYDHQHLANKFSIGSITLPIKSDTLMDKFDQIRRDYAEFNQSHDVWINHYLFNVFVDSCPKPLLRLVLKICDVSTIGFSNLPGFGRIRIGGQDVEHLVFWPPNYLSMGMVFSLLTYDGRIHMGLQVDRTIVAEEEDAHRILRDVFKYLDRMNSELVSQNIPPNRINVRNVT